MNQGDTLAKQAEQLLQSWSIFSKVETACELYVEAGKEYSKDLQWEKAGHVYCKAAELCLKQNLTEAASNYSKAAEAFQNSSSTLPRAVEMYHLAINLYADNNRFALAARSSRGLALVEEKLSHRTEAIDAWKKCMNYFQADNAPVSANQARLKVAEWMSAGDQKEYSEAIQLYEQVAEVAASNSLGKHSMKYYYFNACLLEFVRGIRLNDMKGVVAAMEKYRNAPQSNFSNSREIKVIQGCVDAFNEKDVTKLNASLQEYELFTHLESWMKRIFEEVKKSLVSSENCK